MADEQLIRDVSDTARWVAIYRAQESERKDALFRDPYARRLAGERGQRIVESIPQRQSMAWPMIVRTAVFDEIIVRAVREEGFDTVLNLAAGLDARPWRLDLPSGTRWVDVDLPAILAHKQRELSGEHTHCRYEARAADLREEAARRRVFADVAREAGRVLVVTEGLLIYLEPEQVAALARDLAREPRIARWLIDLASPALLEFLSRRGSAPRGMENAPFRFAPAEGTAFFEPHGWREREFRSTMVEAYRLERTFPFAWFWRLFLPFVPPKRRETWRRFSGYVVLERASG